VVVVTYYDDPDLRKAATSVGAAGYVLKEDLSQLRAFCVQ
jgi:DNA-binding NarL/FixJ family response regulator